MEVSKYMETSHYATLEQRRKIINTLIELSNQSTDIYPRQMKILNELLKSYSVDEILYMLEYVKKHPPKKGIKSLAFLPFISGDAINEMKVAKIKERINQEVQQNREEEETNQDEKNLEKYKSQQRRGVRGTIQF